MKVPTTVQVGGHVYQIRLDPTLTDDHDSGQVNYRTQVIRIHPGRSQSEMRETLVHEILHVVNGVYCAGVLTEPSISGLGEGLNQVLAQLGIEFDWSGVETV